ncbi:MAG TPA: MAPEG family protein [Phycisphaerae bacterium]|nr:MAPEG family protein [Phycisphaerae bacterium]
MHQLLQDPTTRLYVLCAAILVLKMALTGSATGILRLRRGAYVTPEDYAFMGKAAAPPDEDVERLRRVHQNDLENILPFLIIGLLYALSGPAFGLAATLFLAFTAARLLHTATYVAEMQPWRSIFYEVGQISLVVMTILLLVNVLGG